MCNKMCKIYFVYVQDKIIALYNSVHNSVVKYNVV